MPECGFCGGLQKFWGTSGGVNAYGAAQTKGAVAFGSALAFQATGDALGGSSVSADRPGGRARLFALCHEWAGQQTVLPVTIAVNGKI